MMDRSICLQNHSHRILALPMAVAHSSWKVVVSTSNTPGVEVVVVGLSPPPPFYQRMNIAPDSLTDLNLMYTFDVV